MMRAKTCSVELPLMDKCSVHTEGPGVGTSPDFIGPFRQCKRLRGPLRASSAPPQPPGARNRCSWSPDLADHPPVGTETGPARDGRRRHHRKGCVQGRARGRWARDGPRFPPHRHAHTRSLCHSLGDVSEVEPRLRDRPRPKLPASLGPTSGKRHGRPLIPARGLVRRASAATDRGRPFAPTRIRSPRFTPATARRAGPTPRPGRPARAGQSRSRPASTPRA